MYIVLSVARQQLRRGAGLPSYAALSAAMVEIRCLARDVPDGTVFVL
jgi:hypothetical protein